MKKIVELLSFLIFVTMSTSLLAANQVVTSNADDGGGGLITLREAIAAVGEGEEITFDLASGNETITLASELYISKSLTIDGSNASGSGTEIIVQASATAGTATHRVFNITAGTVTISDMTIRYGKSDSGGGIHVNGTSTTLTLENSTISYNTATTAYGGGIYAIGSSLVITNSTINNNLGTNIRPVYGGGILLFSADLNMKNSTVAHNKTSEGGGGIFIKGTSIATIDNSTIAHNHSNNDDAYVTAGHGGGIYLETGSLAVRNSILANNYYGSGTSVGNDYNYGGGTLTDNGFNVVELQNTTVAGQGFQITNNLLNTNPTGLASSLTYEGGFTEVLKVTAGNIASGNAGSTSETTDQRGYYRTSSAITRGAYQFNGIVAKNGSATSWTGNSDVYTTIQAAYTAASTGNTIVLAGTSILVDSEVSISKSITIDGAGMEVTIVRVAVPGTTNSRVFNINASSSTVNISNMHIKGGDISGDGACINIIDGFSSFGNITLSDGKGIDGSGLYIGAGADGVTMENCTISNNQGSSDGGAICIVAGAGTTSLNNCLIINNTSMNFGGGIAVESTAGKVTITNSTFENNIAGNQAGGIGGGASTELEIINSTFVGNKAVEIAGGVGSLGALTLKYVSIVDNNSDYLGTGTNKFGGGLFFQGSTLTCKNTLIANNVRGIGTTADDAFIVPGTVTEDHNIVENPSDPYYTWNSTGDITGLQANLFGTAQATQTLADNGGPTFTLAIADGSVAFGAGIYDGDVTTDQRGESRHNPPTIGAYEHPADPALPVTLTSFDVAFSINNVVLNWVTQSETDNLGFNLFRSESENGFENENFIQINSVLIDGMGTTSEPTNYSFADEYPNIEGHTYYYLLQSVSTSNELELFGPVSLEIPITGQLPTITILESNYPNPFNPETTIAFNIKENETGVLSIFNLKGQRIFKETFETGNHQYHWNAEGLASGIYFYKLSSPTINITKKMILMK
jgi:Secretion system C-terminal sorting domain/Right handed beta helix region